MRSPVETHSRLFIKLRASLGQKEVQWSSIQFRQFAEFYYVYPPLAGFNLRDERLGPVEFLSNLDLS